MAITRQSPATSGNGHRSAGSGVLAGQGLISVEMPGERVEPGRGIERRTFSLRDIKRLSAMLTSEHAGRR
jgi:hypothetical protein